jgi:hypothetical protein
MGRKTDRNEPLAEGGDWIEWGGELVWAAGFMSGGAPYGVTLHAELVAQSEDLHGELVPRSEKGQSGEDR